MACASPLFEPLPERITLIEVGPRDGLQFESAVVPTAMKVELITRLAEAGLRQIQVASFVHPDKVPQMADADGLIRRLPVLPEVVYSALVLNPRGLDRACEVGLGAVEISVSASDAHSRRNAGMPSDTAAARALDMVPRARRAGMAVRAGIQCAFGCVYQGPVAEARVMQMAGDFLDAGADTLALADTTGMATPLQVIRLLGRLLPLAADVPVVLHLHDTRGLGLINLLAAASCGVTRFDTALGGMGGCPFVPGAAGNIGTEDTAYLLASLGVATGIAIDPVADCSRCLETFFRRSFTGRYHRLAAAPAKDGTP